MTGHHNKSNKWACSPLKTVLRKIRDSYQWYCATYQTHTMTTPHRGVGHAGKDRDLNSHIEDARNIDDNESTNSSETTIAFGGSEADAPLSCLLSNSQADFNILPREKHSLQQWVVAREDQPAEGLDHIDCLEQKLWTLSHTQGTNNFNPNTHRTIWRSSMPIHRHTVDHTKAKESHKFPTTGHCHLQWTWFNKIRGMVNRYRNSSRSH